MSFNTFLLEFYLTMLCYENERIVYLMSFAFIKQSLSLQVLDNLLEKKWFLG